MSSLLFLLALPCSYASTYPYPTTTHHETITPYKFHLTFAPNRPPTDAPPRRIIHKPIVPQTPAQDRFFLDDLISEPATIVPKLFGDKPFWVPHAYFNLCPFVRGPDIDPVWSAGCGPLPYQDMAAAQGRPSDQFVFNRFQAMQQAQQQAQQQQAQQEQAQPSWWEQYRPTGPADFGMANMYGPVQQQEMYSYGDEDGGAAASARGGGKRGRPETAGQWGSGFWPFWG